MYKFNSTFDELYGAGYFDCFDGVPQEYVAIREGYDEYFPPEVIEKSKEFWKKYRKREEEERERDFKSIF